MYSTPDTRPSFRGALKKLVFYIIILIVALGIVNYLFILAETPGISGIFENFRNLILFIEPYAPYINAAIILGVGYLIVNQISRLVYAYMRGFADHAASATVQNISRIVGIAVILSILTSVFNINPSAALTVGSFSGLVIGFATQTLLSNTVAGIFLLITRPFTFGDTVTISGQTGIVKEIKLMHLILESDDLTKDILIPNGTVVSQIIQKKKPGEEKKPYATYLMLEKPESMVQIRTEMVFKGKLVALKSRKPIPGAQIGLMDMDIGKDDLLATGITDENGDYQIKWKSKKVDAFDDTAEIYAKFEGDDTYRGANSTQYVVKILPEDKSTEIS